MKIRFSSFIVHLSSLPRAIRRTPYSTGVAAALLLCLANAHADQWILDGRKLVIATDPHAARNFGTNTVYFTTHAVARWVSLTNGLALEVWSESTTNWVRQVEYTED